MPACRVKGFGWTSSQLDFLRICSLLCSRRSRHPFQRGSQQQPGCVADPLTIMSSEAPGLPSSTLQSSAQSAQEPGRKSSIRKLRSPPLKPIPLPKPVLSPITMPSTAASNKTQGPLNRPSQFGVNQQHRQTRHLDDVINLDSESSAPANVQPEGRQRPSSLFFRPGRRLQRLELLGTLTEKKDEDLPPVEISDPFVSPDGAQALPFHNRGRKPEPAKRRLVPKSTPQPTFAPLKHLQCGMGYSKHIVCRFSISDQWQTRSTAYWPFKHRKEAPARRLKRSRCTALDAVAMIMQDKWIGKTSHQLRYFHLTSANLRSPKKFEEAIFLRLLMRSRRPWRAHPFPYYPYLG